MISAKRIDEIFLDCFFKEEELINGRPPEDNAIYLEGLLRPFGFNKARVASHKDEIREILGELHPHFVYKTGGGGSFLNICEDKDGVQWGEHPDGEKLVALAIATGMGKYNLPRTQWHILPGGVPYICLDLEA